jgi:hypothetical protein
MPELSDYDEFAQGVSKIYAERLKRRFTHKPPWQLRKTRDIARALNNPDVSRDLGVLYYCTGESIFEYHKLLIEYLKKNYGLSLEVSESLILACAQKDGDPLVAFKQMDGVRYFNTDLKIVGPNDNLKFSYKNLLRDIKSGDPHVNIRIGRSATKQDVLWFIDKYWDSDIEPISNPYKKDASAEREKPTMLRDATIYSLRQSGWKFADIQKYIADEYDDAIEEPTLRQIHKRHKPQYSLFAKASEQMKAYITENLDDKDFNLEFRLVLIKDGPNTHFELAAV